jgi:hypothetical protein
MIALDDCKERHVYTLKSRNLSLGVCVTKNGEKGFIGIRYKLGDRYLFNELHYDACNRFGTARPIEDVVVLPDNIVASESIDSRSNKALFDYLDAMEKKLKE